MSGSCQLTLTSKTGQVRYLSQLQHTDNTLLAMFCSNMAAEIAKLPL